MKVTKDILTDQQNDCINFPKDRNLLIRGVAGSGKSLVIVNRALELARQAHKMGVTPRIIVFTYINTLVDYMKETMEQDEELGSRITISTLDKEIYHLYCNIIGGNTKDLYKRHNGELECVINNLKEKYPNSRFLKKEMEEFLFDEMEWLKQHMIEDLHTYEENPRKGRGSVHVSKEERRVIFDTYQGYYQLLAEKNMANFDVMCNELYKQRNRIPESEKYDFVFIDEAQDLSLNKMLIAKEITKESMTISADFAQKIYNTGFTWKEVGINIRGQASKKLRGTHRNTKQIALLANSLLEHNSSLQNMSENEYIQPELPDREGAKPVLVYEPSYGQEEEDVQALIKEIRERRPDETVAVLGRDWNTVKKIKGWMNDNDIIYEEIRNKNDYKVLTPGVKVVSYHSSKGLEFDIAILPFLDDGIFPYFGNEETIDDEDEREDLKNQARNLLYVGMTRARSMLYMFACDGGEADPSPLLEEMDQNLMQVKNK